MRFLEQFILEIPYLFLKKIPYAWLGVVFFWSWPPVVSGILIAIVALGMIIMVWQNRAWEARITREFHSGKDRLYIDHPHARWTFQIRNFALLCIASGLLGWLLNGRFNLSGLQWFFLVSGFMLLYKDSLLFGAGVTYIITDQGIGIRFVPGHVDYRLFFKFAEIRQAVRMKVPERIPLRWEVLTPQKHPQEAVKLSAANPKGFSKQIQGELLLAPTDMERFLGILAGRVAVE